MERMFTPVLNHLLQHEDWASARLRRHAGTQVLIEGGPIRLVLDIDPSGRFTAGSPARRPDVTLSLPEDFPFRLLLDREQLFSSVRLAGSVDLAETLAFVFRNLEWDAEADIAKVSGDIIAHRVVRWGKALSQALTQALVRTGQNLHEYMVGESEWLVANTDLVSFSNEVGAVRDDLARLEKRIALLERKLSSDRS